MATGWTFSTLLSRPEAGSITSEASRAVPPVCRIVNNNWTGGSADLSDALDAHSPDVVLFMAGTNDFNNDVERFFSTRFPQLLNNLNKAIDQFLAMPGSDDAWFVVSTLAPKVLGGTPAVLAEYINQGYSTVNGQPVVGDAGNGTWNPGL